MDGEEELCFRAVGKSDEASLDGEGSRGGSEAGDSDGLEGVGEEDGWAGVGGERDAGGAVRGRERANISLRLREEGRKKERVKT